MSPSKDDPAPAPKPAIKGFSLSAKPKPNGLSKPAPASTLGKRPRSTFASHHSDSESDSGNEKRGKHEVVTAFGAEGAVKQDAKRPEGPLVIPKLGNRDWRGEAAARMGQGRGKNLLPAEVQAAQAAAKLEREGGGKGEADVVRANDGEIKWGLTVRKKEDQPGEAAEAALQADTNGSAEVAQESAKPLTADEEAIQALLGEKTGRKADLVIPTARSDEAAGPISEADAYRRAIAEAPEASTLEDYERVPVEEFGAALLRGMGWKGPCADGKSAVKEVKRRQNLLGLGAKELKDAEELGAWVQKSDVKRLNSGVDRRPERRPKASDYRREKERRDEKREERGGGSYRRERERERDDYRSRDRDRDRRR